ncbi:hypothetical protein G3R49_02070 [Shewanella sp. WXL01]|uniref:hypothetical protein n=1 Tax=Shewanella sp. WXL01 TaxID=2709721 RepID=UPI0014384294|nr:hypothetical protein [Shewanella sp. WXL01]NKF49367.1 hypothetical protein [Shewanella sp. WXL01]
MSYKICKQTDERIVLQDTGGIVDFIFGIVWAVLGLGLVYIAWFGYQDSGDLLMSIAIALVGCCFFFPVFKVNRLVIDAVNKEIIKTKSWFGIASEQETVTNGNLSMIEMSGFIYNELESVTEDSRQRRRYYFLRFYSYPEWELSMRDMPTMLNVALFIERHFDSGVAIKTEGTRHKFSALGLLKNYQKVDLPECSLVAETGFQQLGVGVGGVGRIKFWLSSLMSISWIVIALWLVLYTDVLEGFDSIPVLPLQIAVLAFVTLLSGLSINASFPATLKIDHGHLIVKNSLLKARRYPLADVIGAVNFLDITFLLTKNGVERLAHNLPNQHSYAIHTWLLPFIKR